MKNILLILFLCLISCKQKEESINIKTAFDYLVGDWERTNEPEGNHTFEHWKVVDSASLEGHSYTLKGKDTIFNERMKLLKKDNQWSLSVISSNEKPVYFKVTSQENNSFTAQNPVNEFPKKIHYFYFDDVLSAKVSSEEMEVSFIFWRIEK